MLVLLVDVMGQRAVIATYRVGDCLGRLPVYPPEGQVTEITQANEIVSIPCRGYKVKGSTTRNGNRNNGHLASLGVNNREVVIEDTNDHIILKIISNTI
jgi:hypothetical protein